MLLVLLLGACQTPPNKVNSVDVRSIQTAREPASEHRDIHDALFETFFPIERIKDQPELMSEMHQVRNQLWENISTRSEAVWGFRILDLMALFKGGFPKLSVPQREALLQKFEASPINDVRKSVRFLRLYYLYSIYASDLGGTLSGMPRSPVVHPDIDRFLSQHPLRLPISRVIYEKNKGIITHKEGPVDVLVIGSGPAGSVISHELTKKGKKVVLLEQGSFAIPDAVDTRRILSMHESAGVRTSKDGGVIFRNGNAVGGGTTINVDLAFSPLLPSIQNNIEEWRKNNLIAKNQWNRAELEKAYQWIREKVGTRTLVENEINANNMILWEGAKRSGRTPSLYDLNTFTPDTSPSPVINKRSAVSAFIIPALENAQNPLTLIPGAKVLRILWKSKGSEKKIAAGVEFEKVPLWSGQGSVVDPHGLGIPVGTKVRIEARHVIVAAGALGSPALLMRSGLDNPLIGNAPVAHPSIPLMGLFDHPIKIWEGTPSSVYLADRALVDGTILESMTADVSYTAMMLPGNRDQIFDLAKNVSHMGGFGVLLIDKPQNTNKLKIDSKGQPVIDYSISSEDTHRFAKALADAVRIMFRAGARKVYLPTNELKMTELTSIEQARDVESLKFISNRTTITSAHLQATCKMGSHSWNSVVDTAHRVWGTDNVYIVDGSVFPSSVGANPMQSIYTIAKIFADNWKE